MDNSRRDLLIAVAGLAAVQGAPAVAAPAPGGVPAPRIAHVFSARITLAPVIEHGTIDGKRKRFIPITGGTVSGPRLEGVVLPGGGDWQTIDAGGLTDVHARYALKASDGTVISIENPGVRVAAPEIIARLAAGEDVDPSLYYFYTTPRFEVQAGPHEWLRRKVFVGHGIRRPDHVLLDVFEVA